RRKFKLLPFKTKPCLAAGWGVSVELAALAALAELAVSAEWVESAQLVVSGASVVSAVLGALAALVVLVAWAASAASALSEAASADSVAFPAGIINLRRGLVGRFVMRGLALVFAALTANLFAQEQTKDLDSFDIE